MCIIHITVCWLAVCTKKKSCIIYTHFQSAWQNVINVLLSSRKMNVLVWCILLLLLNLVGITYLYTYDMHFICIILWHEHHKRAPRQQKKNKWWWSSKEIECLEHQVLSKFSTVMNIVIFRRVRKKYAHIHTKLHGCATKMLNCYFFAYKNPSIFFFIFKKKSITPKVIFDEN